MLPLERDFEAVATSAGYYRRCVWEGEWVCPIVNARTRRPCAADRSVTVMGAECMIADALTKVVAASVEASAPVLRHFGADALVLESDREGHACRLLQCVQPASAAVH